MSKPKRIPKRKLSLMTNQPGIPLPDTPLPSPAIETPPGHLSTKAEISQVVQEINQRLLNENRDQWKSVLRLQEDKGIQASKPYTDKQVYGQGLDYRDWVSVGKIEQAKTRFF
jgi:hypothetical protein